MKNPTVSLIVTTRNEESNIENSLQSIQKQTYAPIQIIVVDNNSTDKTKIIAKRYTKFVYNKGPERSAQRNYGAEKAIGEYVVFLDCDMILTTKVVEDCVNQIKKMKVGGIIIPEESFGNGFWAQAKSLERSFYIGNDALEAARFFPKKIFNDIGGFDLSLTGPEDWDFSQRVRDKYKLGRIHSFIRHNEGNLSLLRTLQKKYYYSKKFTQYLNKKEHMNTQKEQFSIINRYKILFSKPKKLFNQPLLAIGMIFMKTCEFAAGGLGLLVANLKK